MLIHDRSNGNVGPMTAPTALHLEELACTEISDRTQRWPPFGRTVRRWHCQNGSRPAERGKQRQDWWRRLAITAQMLLLPADRKCRGNGCPATRLHRWSIVRPAARINSGRAELEAAIDAAGSPDLG